MLQGVIQFFGTTAIANCQVELVSSYSKMALSGHLVKRHFMKRKRGIYSKQTVHAYKYEKGDEENFIFPTFGFERR